MDVPEQLDLLTPALAGAIDGIGPEDLDRPTPCAEFTVAGILEHMRGGATVFAAAFRGQAAEGGAPPGGDPVAATRDALVDLIAAIRAPGALDRAVDTPLGRGPAEAFARFVVLDGLVHGWDLSVATGRPYDPPAALVEEVEGFARAAITDDMRAAGAFAAPAEPGPGAGALERLVAFTGREVPAG